MGTFVKFKKSRWYRLFEKGEMTKAEAMDAWWQARAKARAAAIHIVWPAGGPYLTRKFTVTRLHPPHEVITFKVPE